jgi:hypothetical protein
VETTWVGGNIGGIRKTGQYPVLASRIFRRPDGSEAETFVQPGDRVSGNPLPGYSIGYDIQENTRSDKSGVRYSDSIGAHKSPDHEASDIMVQYSQYATQGHHYPTKRSERTAVEEHDANLKTVIDRLKEVSGNGYTVDVPNDSRVISSPNSSLKGYNRLFNTADKNQNPLNYKLGYLKDYRDKNVRMVDNTLAMNVKDASYKLPTAGHFDAINTLTVLGKDRKIENSRLKGWDVYDPYKDDSIAFYFYDVVNEKYIPFRATPKGLNEQLTGNWEELSLIGRSDRVFSYGGFMRNLSFSFSIAISSILELVPTWQRINYLCSLVKPANYTTTMGSDGVANSALSQMSRFSVPPMVMLTLGDVYKFQPIAITSVGVMVPDDAAWETMNSESATEWSYLAGIIKSPKVLYGQLPREVTINLSMFLLEKERAVVGGANFGHAPRTEDYEAFTTVEPDYAQPSEMHKALVVDVVRKDSYNETVRQYNGN